MTPLLNQIQTWLKLPMLWRFVGFASALLGLLCFALSSSFNSLFGEWNFLKSFLYFIFSCFICVAVLFAKTWRRSSSLRLKAHMAFLVLTITSFYSSFFDKHANGKPDAYSLVSCAAFAVMSLSLSRQIHYGIEVDLLYFFLGALILQLTKIKWLLGIAGAGFSYSLIILRSYLDAQPEVNGYAGLLQDQPHVVIQVDSLQSQSSSSSVSAPAVTPQEGNTQDHAATEVDNSHSQQAGADIAFIKPPLLVSIKALKEKNPLLIRLLRRTLRKPFQPDQNLFMDALPSEVINNLNEAVKLAAGAGFKEECCHLYSSCRKEFLQLCLSVLDFFSNEDDNVGMIKNRIKCWVESFEIVVRIVFPNERRLCDRIFFGLDSAVDLSFVQICREPTIRLLKFAKTFSVEISSPEIFVDVVNVFMKLLGIISELESLFPDQDGMSLSSEAISTRRRLGEAVKYAFKDLEYLIRCDESIADVPGGIYPITCDTVNCLEGVLRPITDKAFEGYPMVARREEISPLVLVDEMNRIIEVLERHLEAKSKNYMEPGLSYVSMMNNGMCIHNSSMTNYSIMYMHIIQKKIELSRVASIIDEGSEELFKISRRGYILKLTTKVQQNLEGYLRSSWNEVLGLLKVENEEESMARGVAAESMEEKLQLFNIQFEQICSIQSKWFVNGSIRKEIIKALEKMLLPAYGYFIERFQDVLGKCASEYIQYGMLDIIDQLNRMFLGGASG